jgi:voltage-gated potassium channel
VTARPDGTHPPARAAGSPEPNQRPAPPVRGDSGDTKEQTQRQELLLAIQQATRVPMILLAVLMMALVCLHLAVRLPPASDRRLRLAEWLIWQVFILEFAVTFILAPHKGEFLRKNWILALALVFPFARVLHVLPAAVAFPAQPTFQILAVASRGLQKLAVVLAGRRLLYLFAFTIAAVVSSAVGEFLVEHRAPGTNISTYGDSVWWAAGTITSVGTELYPVTAEGRIIAVFTMAFGVTVVGYLAASIAALFVNVDASASSQQKASRPETGSQELQALREEVRQLGTQIDELKTLLETGARCQVPGAKSDKSAGQPPG